MTRPSVRIDGRTVALEAGETVLDALLRAGIDVGHSCRAGHCHACLVQGSPAPETAQVGLKAPQVEQGLFLACQARPVRDIALRSASSGAPFAARVLERAPLGADVARLRLEPEVDVDYTPGQFVHVEHPSGALRSYSLASYRAEPFLELHVRRVAGGLVSSWLHDEVRVGDLLRLRGPHGSCYYVEGQPDQPLMLLGTGTGLAPLWGIVRDALQRGHHGPIHVVQGARHAERLYLLDELDDLATRVPHVEVHLGALEGASGDVRGEAIDAMAGRLASTLTGPRAFLCGDEGIVRSMQRRLFLAGVASADILADPFVPSTGPPSGRAT